MPTELCFLTVAEASRLIKARKLSPARATCRIYLKVRMPEADAAIRTFLPLTPRPLLH